MNHYTIIPPANPATSNIQWQAKQALENVYPVNHTPIHLPSGTPLLPHDEAVGVDIFHRSATAAPPKPTPVHASHVSSVDCLVAVILGVVFGAVAFFLKYRTASTNAKCNCSGYCGQPPIVNSDEPQPWQ